MIQETVYVAINKNDEVQWVKGSSRKTRYFRTSRYLAKAIAYHNRYHPDDEWKMRLCRLEEVPDPDWV